MLNNDVLRRVRYILDFKDHQMVKIYSLSGLKVSQEILVGWLRKDDDPNFVRCEDIELARFLNGLIEQKRGKREGEAPVAETKLTNNIILRKLMIAFNLKSDDTIKIMKLAGFNIGKPELSAFFRKQGHKNYRECKDQILRNFLAGLQQETRKQV